MGTSLQCTMGQKSGHSRKCCDELGLSFKCYRVFNTVSVKQQTLIYLATFVRLIKPYNWHFLELVDIVLYLKFYYTYLIVNLISGYNIIKALKNKKCQSFVVMLGFCMSFFKVATAACCRTASKNQVSQQTFGCSYFVIALVKLWFSFLNDSI